MSALFWVAATLLPLIQQILKFNVPVSADCHALEQAFAVVLAKPARNL
jgi:hypothetical protein